MAGRRRLNNSEANKKKREETKSCLCIVFEQLTQRNNRVQLNGVGFVEAPARLSVGLKEKDLNSRLIQTSLIGGTVEGRERVNYLHLQRITF